MDIDHFKKINDNFGHLAGDEALCSLAGLLMTTFRDEDLLGRIGGDEFAVLFCGITDKDIVEERCRHLLTQCHAISNRFEITLSIGGSIFRHHAEFEALFSQADDALYEVKHRGRNGVRINAYQKRKDCPCGSEE